ncbi:unnamed protein product, partial [Polarella glacialis]
VHEKCLREWQWAVIGGPNESRALRCSVCDSSFKCGFLGLPEKTPVSEGLWVRSAALFVLVLFAALVLLRICDDSDSGHLQAKELREGMLLVATDRIGTGFFFQSVVLLVEHSTLGAKGYVLNKSPASGLVKAGEMLGGPVAMGSHLATICLGSLPRSTGAGGAKEVAQGVWWQEAPCDGQF